MPEITVNGKQVVIRESFPAGEFFDLPRLWAGSEELPFGEWVEVMARFIESWEFDGEPADVQSWEALDAFREIAPINNEINLLVMGMLTDAKN